MEFSFFVRSDSPSSGVALGPLSQKVVSRPHIGIELPKDEPHELPNADGMADWPPALRFDQMHMDGRMACFGVLFVITQISVLNVPELTF
jgi:hypothetical protein